MPITLTDDEIKRHEAAMQALRDKVRGLEWEIKRLRAIKLPPPSVDCVVAFGHWYGMPVDQDMDIQTEIAWENWQIAWNAGGADSLVRLRQRDSIVAGLGDIDERVPMPAAGAQEVDARIVNLRLDGPEHHREAAAAAGPHGADATAPALQPGERP